jgi:phospho-2-dehydro-3-deoxyheptonate aldolase
LETHGSEEMSNQLDIDLKHRLSNKQYLNQNKMIQMVTENISDSSESQYRIVNKENLEEDEPSETMEVEN